MMNEWGARFGRRHRSCCPVQQEAIPRGGTRCATPRAGVTKRNQAPARSCTVQDSRRGTRCSAARSCTVQDSRRGAVFRRIAHRLADLQPGDRHSCLSFQKTVQVKGQTGMSVPRYWLRGLAQCKTPGVEYGVPRRPASLRNEAKAPARSCTVQGSGGGTRCAPPRTGRRIGQTRNGKERSCLIGRS